MEYRENQKVFNFVTQIKILFFSNFGKKYRGKWKNIIEANDKKIF